MFEITMKWPDGDTFSVDGFSEDQVQPIADFLWAAGADDVVIRCWCGECHTHCSCLQCEDMN